MPSRKIWSFKQELERLYFESKKEQGILSTVDVEEEKSVVGEYVEEIENQFIDYDSYSDFVLEEEPVYDTYPVFDDYPEYDEGILSDEGFGISHESSYSEIISETEQVGDDHPVYDEEIVPTRHVFDEMPTPISVSRAALMNYKHGKCFNFDLQYDIMRFGKNLQDTDSLDACLVDNGRLKPEEEQVSWLYDLVSVSKIFGRTYYVPMLERRLAIGSLRWDSGETRAKQSSGKPPTMELVLSTRYKYSFSLYILLIRSGEIIAWLFVSFDSRINYGAVDGLYLVFHRRSLNVGVVEVLSRPFEGLEEELSSNYIRTEFITFYALLVSIRDGISSSNGGCILGEEHEVVHGFVIGVGFCSLSATQWNIGATHWRPDQGEVFSEVLYAYTGCFLDIGAVIRVRFDLVGFLVFINHILVFMSMIIVDVYYWWLFPILGRTSLIIIGYRRDGTIVSSTGIICSLHVLHHVETPLLYDLVFGGGVIHDALSVVLFGTVGRFIASTLVGKAVLYFLLDFSYLYSTSNLHGVTVGFLITKIIAGLSSMVTRWLVPNAFTFGIVDLIAEVIMVFFIMTVMVIVVDGSRKNRFVLLARVGVLDDFEDDLNHFGWMLLSSLLDVIFVGLSMLLFNVVHTLIFHTLILIRGDYPYLFITSEEACITAHMLTRAEVMKGTRVDLGMMIPKTWKHDVMVILVAMIWFSVVNSEYFGMEYLGRIYCEGYCDGLIRSELVFGEVGALFTITEHQGDFKERTLPLLKEVPISNRRRVLLDFDYAIAVLMVMLMGIRDVLFGFSLIDAVFGDRTMQEVLKAYSEMVYVTFQLLYFVFGMEDGFDVSELRSIPRKGGGDDTNAYAVIFAKCSRTHGIHVLAWNDAYLAWCGVYVVGLPSLLTYLFTCLDDASVDTGSNKELILIIGNECCVDIKARGVCWLTTKENGGLVVLLRNTLLNCVAIGL